MDFSAGCLCKLSDKCGVVVELCKFFITSCINLRQKIDSCHPLIKIRDYSDDSEVWKKIRRESFTEQII